MESKHFLESRTLWFNVAVAVFAGISGNLDSLRPFLSDGGYAVLMILVAAGNAWLRTITTGPVGLKK